MWLVRNEQVKLYNGFSPNGIRVSAFLAEKGIEIPIQPIDISAGEPREPSFLKLNSLAEVPVLELDDGTVITESMAICRYLEAQQPERPLFGNDPIAQAQIEMWNRRIELRIFNVIGDVGRHEFELFKSRGQVPEYAQFRRVEFVKKLRWLDSELSDGRPFVAGEQFSVADITGMATLLLITISEFEVPGDCAHVSRWFDTLRSRPSFPSVPTRK